MIDFNNLLLIVVDLNFYKLVCVIMCYFIYFVIVVVRVFCEQIFCICGNVFLCSFDISVEVLWWLDVSRMQKVFEDDFLVV